MAISSEIDKLERRWHENPSGLMFAPLAEAYRKAGNHERALEILEVGLAVHPDYVPALIVRGRCLLDAGDLASSESAFHQVLARDPVNPIALRSLADLYERSGRTEQAMERLSLLLEADAGDGDARASLARLRNQPAPEPSPVASPVTEWAPAVAADAYPEAPPSPVAEPAPILGEGAPEARAEDALGIENLSVDPMASGEQVMPAEPLGWEPTSLPPQWSETVTLSLVEAPSPEPESELPAAGSSVEPVSAAQVEPIIWTPAEVEPVAPPEPVPPLFDSMADLGPEPDAAPSVELPVPPVPPASELVEVAPAAEIPESQAAQELAPPESPEAATLPWPGIEEPIVAQEPTVAEAAEPEPEVIPASPVASGPLAEPVPEEPTLIVTESMAELFLKQGHRELALAVYRQLAERAPEDPRLRDAIVALEAELAPPAPEPEPEPEPVRYAAAQTGGMAVEAALQAVLRTPPPASASTVLPPAIEPGLPGESTRANEQPLSLGSVFGDEPPVSPAPAAESGSPAAPAEPSYDEFFGAVPPGEPAVSGSMTGRQSEAEDLRQFNEWLKGLKR